MGTLKGGYHDKAGIRVPSVTSLLPKPAGPLMYWSWKISYDGLMEARALLRSHLISSVRMPVIAATRKFLARPEDDWNYRAVRDKAADAGTMAHEAVEAWIHKQPIKFEGPEDVCAKARKAFEAFLEWVDQTQLVVTQTELPLVSEKHKYGGTFDAILVKGKRAMGDWKSSNAIYPEYLIQVRAYGGLWEENFPDEPITGGYHLLRFDKTYGDFHAHWWGELDAAWEAFLHLRALYEIEKELKARAK